MSPQRHRSIQDLTPASLAFRHHALREGQASSAAAQHVTGGAAVAAAAQHRGAAAVAAAQHVTRGTAAARGYQAKK